MARSRGRRRKRHPVLALVPGGVNHTESLEPLKKSDGRLEVSLLCAPRGQFAVRVVEVRAKARKNKIEGPYSFIWSELIGHCLHGVDLGRHVLAQQPNQDDRNDDDDQHPH